MWCPATYAHAHTWQLTRRVLVLGLVPGRRVVSGHADGDSMITLEKQVSGVIEVGWTVSVYAP